MVNAPRPRTIKAKTLVVPDNRHVKLTIRGGGDGQDLTEDDGSNEGKGH